MGQPGQRRRPSKRDERVSLYPVPVGEAFRALLGVPPGGVDDEDDGYGPDDNQAPAPGQ